MAADYATVVRVYETRIEVKLGNRQVASYGLSRQAQLDIARLTLKAGDAIKLEVRDRMIVSLERAHGSDLTRVEGAKTQLQEGLTSVPSDRAKPDQPAAPTAPDPAATLSSRPDQRSVGDAGAVGQDNLREHTTGSKNPTTARDFRDFEQARGSEGGSVGSAVTQSAQPGQRDGIDASFQGADPRLATGESRRTYDDVERTFAEKVVKWVVEKVYVYREYEGSNATAGGVRGYCADTSAVCAATGRTWADLSSDERLSLCAEFKKESDKVKGGATDNTVQTCAKGFNEPDWRTVFGIKTSPLIRTTGEGGGAANQGAATPVPTAGGKQGELIDSLKDPRGGTDLPNPNPPTPGPGSGSSSTVGNRPK